MTSDFLSLGQGAADKQEHEAIHGWMAPVEAGGWRVTRGTGDGINKCPTTMHANCNKDNGKVAKDHRKTGLLHATTPEPNYSLPNKDWGHTASGALWREGFGRRTRLSATWQIGQVIWQKSKAHSQAGWWQGHRIAIESLRQLERKSGGSSRYFKSLYKTNFISNSKISKKFQFFTNKICYFQKLLNSEALSKAFRVSNGNSVRSDRSFILSLY